MSKLFYSQNEHVGYGMILLAGILWGMSGVFVKNMAVYGVSPIFTAFLRVSMAFVIMLVFCIAKFGIKSLKITNRQLLLCGFLGFICHGIYNIFYNWAIVSLGISFSTVLLYLSPALTLILSAIIYNERISALKIVAIIANVFGCALTVTNGQLSLKGLSFTGIVFALGACACYSMNSIIGKKAERKINPFVMSMYSYFFASLLLMVMVKPWAIKTAIDPAVYGWGFLYALIPTAFTYGIYYCGMQKITDCSKVPVIASIEIVVASVMGVLFYHEHVGAVSVIGIGLVLISIVVMNAGRRIYRAIHHIPVFAIKTH